MPDPSDDAAPRHVLTPSSLNRLVRDLLGDALPQVWIEGELSNVARPASGHLYFTLKDSTAQVRCAMFKLKATALRFRPADGMQVLLRAKVGLYEPRGEFQLVAEYMEPAGEGALQREFEQLKARPAPVCPAHRRDHLGHRRGGARCAERAGATLAIGRRRGIAGAGAGSRS